MRLQSRPLAVVGLVALGLVALGLLQHRLSVEQAGTRGLVVLVALVAVDRVVLPVARLLVGPAPHERPGDA